MCQTVVHLCDLECLLCVHDVVCVCVMLYVCVHLCVYIMWCFLCVIIYVSLRLRVQNAVPAQPCVGKIRISLVLFNFLHCNFKLWFETP